MLIKCNCLIAKCWEPILRGFQWNYLISSQEVHCRIKKRGGGEQESEGGRGRNGRAEKARKSNRNGVFLSERFPREILTAVYI